MTRTLYAGRIGDTVASLYQAGDGKGRVFLAVPADAQGYPTPVVFTVWDEPDGTQITDLLAADGTTAITTVTVPASDIQVPGFYGPDGLTADVWLKDPAGVYFRMDASPDASAAAATAAAERAEAAAAGVPAMWQPLTVYTANSIRVAPDGSTLSRIANGTSRATFDPTEQATWEPVIGKAGTIDKTSLIASYVAPRGGLQGGATEVSAALEVDIRNFGAKSDAEVFQYDSGPAIQAAIDYVSAEGGGVVTIPNFTPVALQTSSDVFRIRSFRTGQTLIVKYGVTLRGLGPLFYGSRLIGMMNGDVIRFQDDGNGSGYVAPCCVRDIHIRGKFGSTSGCGISTRTASGTTLSLQHGVTLSHIGLEDHAEDGLRIYGGSGVNDVDNIFGFQNGGYGTHLFGTTVQMVGLTNIYGDSNVGGAALCIEDTVAGYVINITNLKSENSLNVNRGSATVPSQPQALLLKNCAGRVNINGLQHISGIGTNYKPGDAIAITGANRPRSLKVAGHEIRYPWLTQTTGTDPVLIRDTVGGGNVTVPMDTASVVYTGVVDYSQATTVKVPTVAQGDSSTKAASTAYVDTAARSAIKVWAGATDYLAYEHVTLPTGGRGYLTAARTSRATFDATERDFWTFLAGGHEETLTSGTTWKAPLGITRLLGLDLLGGGAGGNGGGCALGGITQVGGPGGAAGERVILRDLAVTPATSYTYAIGAAGTGGAGGAAGANNPGTVGVKGGDSTFTIGASAYKAGGGNIGAQSLGSSTSTSGAGMAGGIAWTVSSVGIPGTGGVAASNLGNAPFPSNGVIGGAAGGPSTATLGGVGGGARTSVGGAVSNVGAGGSGTTAGGNGVTATRPGCGGGGGGGGVLGGAGGTGGDGAAGRIVVEF